MNISRTSSQKLQLLGHTKPSTTVFNHRNGTTNHSITRRLSFFSFFKPDLPTADRTKNLDVEQQQQQQQVNPKTTLTPSKTPEKSKGKGKTIAQLDEELRQKMDGRAGDGGEAGMELEDGKPVAMKKSVRENMFRYI